MSAADRKVLWCCSENKIQLLCAQVCLSFSSACKYRRRLCMLFNDAHYCWDYVPL